MTRHPVLWILALGALALPHTARALQALPDTLPADSAVRAVLEERMASGRHPAIVVGLLDQQGARIVALGQADPAGRVTLDGNTVFEIGSVTKVVTSILLADMALRNEVALDDPVARYLPDSVRVPARDGQPITLEHLATHTSGLPRMPHNFRPADPENPYADYGTARMYAFLAGYRLPRAVGARYEYSNLGVGLLGHALARHAGTAYEPLVRSRVLEPLALHATGITLDARARARLAVGHDPMGNPTANWDIPTLAGAGALRSTANDLLRFLAANLRAPEGPLGPALRETHRVRSATGNANLDIALAWHVLHRPDADIHWHNGGTGGYHSFVGFDGAREMGVVVLTNSTHGIDDIGFHLLDPGIPLAHPEPLERRTAVAIDPEILEHYVGEYRLSPTFTITVTREDDRLFVQATNQPRFEIFAESETEFFLTAVEAQLTFVRDAGGTVTGLVLHQGGRDVPGEKIR